MNKTMKNTFRSVGALALIAAVCITILAIANAIFPKAVPILDLKTVELIDSIVDLGIDPQQAFDQEHIVMLNDDSISLEKFNKDTKKTTGGEVLACYMVLSGDKSGFYAVESRAKGYRGDINILLVYAPDGNVFGGVVKSHSEDRWDTVERAIDIIFDYIAQSSDDITVADLQAVSGATPKISLKAVAGAVNTANAFVSEYNESIMQIIQDLSGGIS